MPVERREFLKALAGAATLPYRVSNRGDPSQATEVDRLYDQSIVIDSLAVAHRWDEIEFGAIKESGYTGIQTSLPNWNLQVALRALAEWNQRVKDHSARLAKATRAADFERAKREAKMAVVFGFQNSTAIEDDANNLDVLYQLGTRCIQLTYNSRNLVGDGCTEPIQTGLSEFGISVVERMNELGIIIDLSHCGRQTTREAIEYSQQPPAFTHTMCEAIYKHHPRAKTDEQMKALSDKGGVVGIAALGYFVGKSPETNFEDYLNHIDHAVKVAGIDHVGLATDFPIRGIQPWATRENWYEPRLRSFKPSYNVRWPPWIPELDEPGRFRNVAHGLAGRGYRTGEIEKILGRNWLRYFQDVFGS
jgi:membrane dipeptidase